MTLHDFFVDNPKAAIAFSGGTDSAYLLYAAIREGADVCAYYVKSEFQPRFELEDARRMAGELGAGMKVIPLEVLNDVNIASNSKKRCYYCKKAILSAILGEAGKDGYTILLDGTNMSDEISDRPGMTALSELSVCSPLRECGLTKEDIRRLSREAGLFTWDKPAYACLATRIPERVPITEERLVQTERAEDIMMRMGFSDFRVRLYGSSAGIQVRESQLMLLMEKRNEVLKELKKYYSRVMLDLEVRDE